MAVIFPPLHSKSFARFCSGIQGFRSFEMKTLVGRHQNIIKVVWEKVPRQSQAKKLRQNFHLPNFFLYHTLHFLGKRNQAFPFQRNMKHCFSKTGSDRLKIKQWLPMKSVAQLHPFKKDSC